MIDAIFQTFCWFEINKYEKVKKSEEIRKIQKLKKGVKRVLIWKELLEKYYMLKKEMVN